MSEGDDQVFVKVDESKERWSYFQNLFSKNHFWRAQVEAEM